MDPHRIFGHHNSGYYFPAINRSDPYLLPPPPREFDDRVFRLRPGTETRYYLPTTPSNRDYLDIPRRRIPPPYVEPPSPSDRHYRPVRRSPPPRRNSPPPPLHSPPSCHHHHKSSRKKSKKKKRSRSKSIRNSEYEDDSPYEYEPKTRNEYERRSQSCEKETHHKFKILSDEHDSFSDADFDSPVQDYSSKDTNQVDYGLQKEGDSLEHSNSHLESHNNDCEKSLCSNSQDATKHYTAYKLLHDPHLKPGGTGKLLYRFDGVVPNNINFPIVQVRDPRSPVGKIWGRREPLDLPVPLFKVR